MAIPTQPAAAAIREYLPALPKWEVVAGGHRGRAVLHGRLGCPSHSLVAGKVPHAAVAVIDAGSGG